MDHDLFILSVHKDLTITVIFRPSTKVLDVKSEIIMFREYKFSCSLYDMKHYISHIEGSS